MVTTSYTPDFLAELSALDANVAALFATPAERLIRQPGPGKWSALQAIEHIVLINQAYFPALATVIAKARTVQTPPTEPFRYTPLGRFLVRSFEPPPKLRLPVPSRSVVPPLTTDVDAVHRSYEAHHATFRQCIHDAATIDMRRVKIRSPFAKIVSIPLGTAIGGLLAHERRHVYQARRAAG